MALQLTWYDSNSWLIEWAGQRILLDPWLVDSLTFGNMPWLFKGDRPRPLPVPESIDWILLSQGLEDHAHPPTLQALPKSIPVIGSPNAAKVARSLGYESVTAIAPGETLALSGSLELTAFPGSPIGPTLIENAYLLGDRQTGSTLYYEPHGYHSEAIKTRRSVDVILTPIVGISLMGILPVLNGQQTTLELCQALHPQIVVPTAGAGEVTYEGLLTKVLRLDGTIAGFRNLLASQGLEAQVLEPPVGVPITLPVRESIGQS